MSFSEKRGTDEADDKEDDRPRDLLCGLGTKHIRLLCDNPWEGGRGYTPSQVADMTLDQIFFLLCDKNNLRGTGKTRTKAAATGALPIPGKDGLIAGRDIKGNPIRLPVLGESKAARLTREAAEKKAVTDQDQSKRRRRRGT